MPPGFDEGQIEELFTYHPPQGDQVERYVNLREAHKELAKEILNLTPSSPEQTLAIRALHRCSMHANSAIALEPPGTEDLHAHDPSG